MFSSIILNKENLIHNIKFLKETAGGNICAMVKANAYGHGAKEIVGMLKGEVEYFGVSNQTEAEEIRTLTDAHIIVFGACDNYEECIKQKISFSLLNFKHAKEMVKIYKKIKIKPQMHLCINSGMNRYGIRDKSEFLKIINLLNKNDIILEGIYTHFSSLTTDENYTEKQYKIFQEFCALLPSKETLIHVGGGNTIFKNFKAELYRVGLEIYGYGNKHVKPVLSIESEIIDIQSVKKGEHVGYLSSFTAKEDMKVATIPLGYGDGLPRKLSNKLIVNIKGKNAQSTGNICMDAFMVDVTDIKCKVGDKVKIMGNASNFAPIIESTEYEVLTNLTKFRGKRKII